MTARLRPFLRQAALFAIAGVSFSLWQRFIDFLIDQTAGHVTWLAWLG